MKIKNMRNILLFGLCFVLSLKEVLGQSENEIKRGTYPYMAIVYYPDVTIVGSSGVRFSRSAVLIRPDWLISSSLETDDIKLVFPQKTLLARVGAIVIDSNFTINEDEGEEEREIIQIIRPTNFVGNQWWYNDITLLKTLAPFTLTSTVASASLSSKPSYLDKTCYILVFAKKYSNSTDEKALIQLTVELLPTSNENCGTYFRNETMICASNSDENKKIVYEPDFCTNNDGGPLICDGDVIGLQTYFDNNCKQPYIYQHLSAWDDFITCGVEDKCRMQECANICVNIDKDDETIEGKIPKTSDIIAIPTSETSKHVLMDQPSEDTNDEEHVILQDTTIPKVRLFNEQENPTPTRISTAKIITTKETTLLDITEDEEKSASVTDESVTSWPKEKLKGYRKNEDGGPADIERTTIVEAQHHEAKTKLRSAAESYIVGQMALIYRLLFGFFICII